MAVQAMKPNGHAAESARVWAPAWPWLCAAAAVLAVLAWQAATVRANYSRNWTGLFRTGAAQAVPAALQPLTVRNAHPDGYDGQFFRYLAHDPFLRPGMTAYLDSPERRARRILVPLLAWALGLGRVGAVDCAYLAVILGFIFAGVYWLARAVACQGAHPALGLLFLAVPATLVAADTMTVDVALAALTACLAWQLLSGRERWVCATLAAACLVRETGLLLAAACSFAALLEHRRGQAVARAGAALPALGWYAYVHAVIPPAIEPSHLLPLWTQPELKLGVLARALHPPRYPLLAAPVESLVRGLDSAALLSMAVVSVLGFLLLRTGLPPALRFAASAYSALLLGISNQTFWAPPYGYSRPFAPLFVLLLVAVGSAPRRRLWWCALAATLLVDLRVLAETKTQVEGVLRWLGAG